MNSPCRVLLLLLLGIVSKTLGHGEEKPANQFVILRDLPPDMDPQKPQQVVIRDDFEGEIEFINADSFSIEINVTASSNEKLAEFHYGYEQHEGAVLLQLYESKPEPEPGVIGYLLLLLGGGTGIALILSIIFVCWWNVTKRKLVQEHKVTCPDSSQAPLLDGRLTSDSSTPNGGRPRRRKKKHVPTAGEAGYVSSEDDQGHHHPNPPASPNRIYAQVVKKTSPRKDGDMMGSVARAASSELLTSSSATPQSLADLGSDKPVVSYIKLQSGEAKRKGAQYIPLGGSSEGSGSDIEKQATLKIRRDAPPDSSPMPDVIRRGQYHGDHNVPLPPRHSSTYVPLSGGGAVTDDPNDPVYSNINKLSGAHVATLLRDRSSKPASKYQQSSIDNPNLSSFATNPRRHDRDESVDLESVSSSRSGASSASNRPQSAFSDGDRKATDSDSAPSTASSGARSKDSGLYSGRYYANTSQSPQNTGLQSSSSTDSGNGSSSRLVDEAYGTMGSNSSGSSTIRSSSTASTGSGSSGSVITVITADDSASGNGRRRVKCLPDPTAPVGNGNGNGALHGGRRDGGGRPPKYLQMSFLCALTVLCLTSGVFAQFHDKMTVHIKVYAPAGFLKYRPEIYVSKHKPVTVDPTVDVSHYEVDNPILPSEDMNMCISDGCPYGCDAHTGNCVCPRGYRLVDGRCVDIDECAEGSFECQIGAECMNREGNYTCRCQSGYYSYGPLCKECSEPCHEGTYEDMSCDSNHGKICQGCKKCLDEYYKFSACTATSDTECRPCSARCRENTYEYTPCAGSQDRECREISDLPGVSMSSHLIYEDRSKVTAARSERFDADTSRYNIRLERGSDFSVEIDVSDPTQLRPLFKPVDHSDSNDNDEYPDELDIPSRFCSWPVPESYRLQYESHQDVTTEAEFYECNAHKGSQVPCYGETGFYLNSRVPCETHLGRSGKFPDVDDNWSVLCSRSSKLADLFVDSTHWASVTTVFQDTNSQCANRRRNCQECLKNAARSMRNSRGSHRCNITSEAADNGETPRLMYCYSCRSKDNCEDDCSVYKDADCEQTRCITGNLAEFKLVPDFPDSNKYACHIEPATDYAIYDIRYSVHDAREGRVNNRVLTARKVVETVHPASAVDQHNFLKVHYGSRIITQPDLLEISDDGASIMAGYYQVSGTPLENERRISGTSVKLRPRSPFSVSTKSWKRHSCDTVPLDKLVMTGSRDGYRRDTTLDVRRQVRETPLYEMFNASSNSEPYLYFEIPAEASVLRAMFDNTTVKDDSTLKAELKRNSRSWLLKLSGELQNCPGAFQVIVKDPGYPGQSLFNLDVGVERGCSFAVNFTIPTGARDEHDKQFRVEIIDSYRTIKIGVFRPAPNVTEEVKDTPVNYVNKGEKPMTIFTPFIAVLCVIISFLFLLLVVGFVTESGKSRSVRKADNKVHSQHLLFVVCYVTFRSAYSIAITFTVLVLLIRHVNRNAINALGEFGRFAETAENQQQKEILTIQKFVIDELKRQNALANETKFRCEGKLAELQHALEEKKQQMRVENAEERLVSSVALEYTKRMVVRLEQDITNFKANFNSYVTQAINDLARSLATTQNALEDNVWLSGAKIIHEVVQSKRRSQQLSEKNFMEWVGLRNNVEGLAADLSLKNFPIPNLTEFTEINAPQPDTKQSSIPLVEDITLPRNQWYYRYEEPIRSTDNKPAAGSGKGHRLKVKGSDIISWTSLITILVVIDLIWFIHRMAKSYSTAKMILYGYPSFVDYKKPQGSEGNRANARSNNGQMMGKKCLNFLKDLNFRVMKTEFVPKLVATVTTCCVIYLVLVSSGKLLTVKTLASVGYFNSMVAPVETSYQLAKTRIKTNAYRINKFEFPFYEELVNLRTKRYQLMLELYAELQKSNNLLRDSEYCAWKKMLSPDEPCNCTTATAGKLPFEGCDLPPITPQGFQKRDFGVYREEISRSLVPYINAGRQVVMDTCHLVLVFVAVLVLVDALGSVTWIYLKRFSLLRQKPMFEIEHFPVPDTNHIQSR